MYDITSASPISTSHHVGLDEPKGCRWMMGIGSPRTRSPGAHYQKARTAQCYHSQLNLEQARREARIPSGWVCRRCPAHAACVIAKALVPLVTSYPGTRFLATGQLSCQAVSRPKGLTLLTQGFFSSRLVLSRESGTALAQTLAAQLVTCRSHT